MFSFSFSVSKQGDVDFQSIWNSLGKRVVMLEDLKYFLASSIFCDATWFLYSAFLGLRKMSTAGICWVLAMAVSGV